MNDYNNLESYLSDLTNRAHLPAGFKVSTNNIEFFPHEKESKSAYKMNLSLIYLEKATDSFGAVFTKNRFPGFPVIIGRKLLQKETIQGVLINNRIANVGAINGEKTALNICLELEKLCAIEKESIIPSSTGIIGWSLPKKEIIEGLPKLVNSLKVDSVVEIAKNIMTTDSFPKVRSISVGDGIITAVVKGAGMIEPNMATMLAFILTDLDIERELLRSMLKEVVDESFNSISVDSDQSTSDSVIMLSSRLKEVPSKSELRQKLSLLLKSLAEDVVRNGEGTSHVIRVRVNGFENDKIAKNIGKAIINSPLVKSALFGNDPNVGRIISSVGDYCGNNCIELNVNKMELFLGDESVFSNGEFCLDEVKEDNLYQYLLKSQLPIPSPGYPTHNNIVDIRLIVEGSGACEVLGSDLSYEYIRENAEYRS